MRLHARQRGRVLTAASAAGAPPAIAAGPEIRGVGEVAEVETLEGVRVRLDEDTTRPFVEYLVKWKVRVPCGSRPLCHPISLEKSR